MLLNFASNLNNNLFIIQIFHSIKIAIHSMKVAIRSMAIKFNKIFRGKDGL